jgi:acetolactate synthase I/II/III large subunit
MIDPYHFLDVLSDETAEDEVIIPDCGANLIQTFQAYRVKHGQRLFSAFNNSPMGYSLSGAIGACLALGRRRVVCITGDGGLALNIQELGTIALHKLPIKIFVLNNHGHGIIQQTQEDWLDGSFHASRPQTGLGDPNFYQIAQAFGFVFLKYLLNADDQIMRSHIRGALDGIGPCLHELEVSQDQRIAPMLKAGRPIEDANPLLSREEFNAQMGIQ